MSRFLNLPQRSEVPEDMAEQFFGRRDEDKAVVVTAETPKRAEAVPSDAQRTHSVSARPSTVPSSGRFLAKGSGPLGGLGIGQLALGLALLLVDAWSNPLSQCSFCVSASLFAVLCAVFSFVTASRWPDHSSLWLLLPCCLCSALLWACLCAEAAHSLVAQSGAKCVEPVPPLGLSWLEQERLEKLRPCLGPALHSLLLCAGLIGVFLSLCSLLICCRALRPSTNNNDHSPSFATAARRPFSLLVAPAGTPRPEAIRLPLLKANGAPATTMANHRDEAVLDGLETR